MSSFDEEKSSSSETSEDEDEDETCSPAPKRAASDAVPKSSGKKSRSAGPPPPKEIKQSTGQAIAGCLTNLVAVMAKNNGSPSFPSFPSRPSSPHLKLYHHYPPSYYYYQLNVFLYFHKSQKKHGAAGEGDGRSNAIMAFNQTDISKKATVGQKLAFKRHLLVEQNYVLFNSFDLITLDGIEEMEAYVTDIVGVVVAADVFP